MSCGGVVVVGETNENIFEIAIVTNNINLAKSIIHLVNANSYFNHRKELPLHLSVKNGNLNMVKFLIENGADVNMMDRSFMYPLHYACQFVYPKIASILISAGANPNIHSIRSSTPLLLAIETHSLELVKILVESGADIEKQDQSNGNTPLNQACYNYPSNTQIDIVDYLIKCGANVNSKNYSGLTPLLTAILANYNLNVRLIKLLLRSGCNPNEANLAGISPLLAAIRRSSDHFDDGNQTVQLLIDHGCNVNAREFENNHHRQQPIGLSPGGDTALNISIDRNQDSITEKLIRNGADVGVENLRGETPIFSLIRDRKYVLARQALATLPIISTKDLQQLSRYLSDEYRMNEDPKNFQQIKQFLFQQPGSYFPRLMHLCRCSIRKSLGRYSDRSIEYLKYLPESIRSYLMLKQL
ncbi:hypothetical protein DERP_003583 [Dermatophagoides pteronyssinus]|uniref:SOCS box domain-containing protein n=1 Tax=Dermatophagoides pteronyssinus TaxID=6956 RepID=A0ABQ8JL17_DERPT|nr:hypothetical protein DERP_003583 [Dermatophagoides pteronyssinus]